MHALNKITEIPKLIKKIKIKLGLITQEELVS